MKKRYTMTSYPTASGRRYQICDRSRLMADIGSKSDADTILNTLNAAVRVSEWPDNNTILFSECHKLRRALGYCDYPKQEHLHAYGDWEAQ